LELGQSLYNQITLKDALDKRASVMLTNVNLITRHMETMETYENVSEFFVLLIKQVSWWKFRYGGALLPFGTWGGDHSMPNPIIFENNYFSISQSSDPLSSWNFSNARKVHNLL
jgi:hypothetical protein